MKSTQYQRTKWLKTSSLFPLSFRERAGVRMGSALLQLAALCLGILLVAAPAGAKDLLLVGGAEGGGGSTAHYYTFLGAVAPLPGSNFGNGFMQKYKVDVLGYQYPGPGNQDVTANGVGVEGALGYAKSGEKGWAGAYGGVRYSNTWLSPDDPKARIRGSLVRPTVQVEGERTVTADWKVNGMASYIFISDGYWARGRVMYRAKGTVYTGPEFIAQGDPDYRAWSGGWFVNGFEPLPKSSVGFKAGARKIEKDDLGAYVGVEFSRMF